MMGTIKQCAKNPAEPVERRPQPASGCETIVISLGSDGSRLAMSVDELVQLLRAYSVEGSACLLCGFVDRRRKVNCEPDPTVKTPKMRDEERP